MREKYLLNFSPGMVLALWYDNGKNGMVTIGGNAALRKLALDVAVAAFSYEMDDSDWKATSQRNKYRMRFRCSRKAFDEGIAVLRDKLFCVVNGPLRSVGRVAI